MQHTTLHASHAIRNNKVLDARNTPCFTHCTVRSTQPNSQQHHYTAAIQHNTSQPRHKQTTYSDKPNPTNHLPTKSNTTSAEQSTQQRQHLPSHRPPPPLPILPTQTAGQQPRNPLPKALHQGLSFGALLLQPFPGLVLHHLPHLLLQYLSTPDGSYHYLVRGQVEVLV